MTDRTLDPIPWFGTQMQVYTTPLSDRQEAWFFRCVSWQWEHGYIPIDEQSLRKIARPEFGALPGEWARFYELSDWLFPACCEYQGQNPTVAELRADYVRVIEAKSEGGKRSGEVRRVLKESTKSV